MNERGKTRCQETSQSPEEKETVPNYVSVHGFMYVSVWGCACVSVCAL